jgi:hypothetical protein
MCAPSSLSQASTWSKHCHPVTNLSFVFVSLFSSRPIFGEEQGGRAVEVAAAMVFCGPFPAKRLLVVCDNASVHKAQELREKLEQHGIILRFLPPNMTAWLQPLDLVVCGLIKTLQRARRGRHLAGHLKAWKQKQDEIMGAALMANNTPPPLEPWRRPI